MNSLSVTDGTARPAGGAYKHDRHRTRMPSDDTSASSTGPEKTLDHRKRSHIKPGLTVDIVLKKDQRSGRTTRGIVRDLLTRSPRHPHGIKVRLADGQIGRVKRIITG